MRQPIEVTDVDIAFGNISNLPPWDEIPDEFKKHSNPHAKVVSQIFFSGGKLTDFGLTLKEGVDGDSVYRAIRACLCSWEPKHEHKEAGVAMLLAEWFDGEPKL